LLDPTGRRANQARIAPYLAVIGRVLHRGSEEKDRRVFHYAIVVRMVVVAVLFNAGVDPGGASELRAFCYARFATAIRAVGACGSVTEDYCGLLADFDYEVEDGTGLADYLPPCDAVLHIWLSSAHSFPSGVMTL